MHIHTYRHMLIVLIIIIIIMEILIIIMEIIIIIIINVIIINSHSFASLSRVLAPRASETWPSDTGLNTQYIKIVYLLT